MTATLAQTELTARVVGIVWQAEDGSAVIARVIAPDGTTVAVKGQTDPESGLPLQMMFSFNGQWMNHERHGRQFQFTSYSKVIPHDKRGVLAYLTNTVDGVGERTALKLWDAFGTDAVQVLREQPERVTEAGILSAERAKEAALELHNEAAFEAVKIDLLSLFQGRGFQHAKLIRECIKQWGRRAQELIRRNPYLLMIRGMTSAGFNRCDKLYLDRGGNPARLKRQVLCAWHALRMDQSGHTWMRQSSVIDAIQKAMPLGKARPGAALALGVRAGWLAGKTPDGINEYIAERNKAKAEETVAREVLRLSRGGLRPASKQRANQA